MDLELREYKESDLDRHLELFLMNGILDKVDEDSKLNEGTWLRKVIDNYSKDEPEFYVLAIIFEGNLIGNLVAEKFDFDDGTAEVGFWIGRDYWNKGIASVALRLFLDKITDKFKLKKVFASHKEDNLSSGRVLGKNGFVLDKSENETIFYHKNVS